MQKVPEKIYSLIDNDIYNLEGEKWWQSDFSLNLIRTLINPFRVNYAKNILQQLEINSGEINALEVGCGGGILTEEIAKMGFITTGIGPLLINPGILFLIFYKLVIVRPYAQSHVTTGIDKDIYRAYLEFVVAESGDFPFSFFPAIPAVTISTTSSTAS